MGVAVSVPVDRPPQPESQKPEASCPFNVNVTVTVQEGDRAKPDPLQMHRTIQVLTAVVGASCAMSIASICWIASQTLNNPQTDSESGYSSFFKACRVFTALLKTK